MTSFRAVSSSPPWQSFWLVTHLFLSSWMLRYLIGPSWLVKHLFLSSWMLRYLIGSSWLVKHLFRLFWLAIHLFPHSFLICYIRLNIARFNFWISSFFKWNYMMLIKMYGYVFKELLCIRIVIFYFLKTLKRLFPQSVWLVTHLFLSSWMLRYLIG
jgi:hypothetical protein